MSVEISAEIQVALMLLLPPARKGVRQGIAPLKPREFRGLARWLEARDHGWEALLQDGRLVGEAAQAVQLDPARLRALLGRGFEIAARCEAWAQRSIWVLGWNDPRYPRRLLGRFEKEAPALLWGVGSVELLEQGGLAIVGSRDASPSTLEFAAGVARLSAEAGVPVVSGGAQGVDRVAMLGTLEAGGASVGVLPGHLWRAPLRQEWREHLADGRLVLVSPWVPEAGFTVGRAMGRNRHIYGLADAALVVECTRGKGGTWAGATEQLERLRFVPVFVPRTAADSSSEGLTALVEKGALRWPDPRTRDELLQLLRKSASEQRQENEGGPTPRSSQESSRPKQLRLPGLDGS